MVAIRPGFQMPALSVEMKPVQRAVGDDEVALRVQRAASRLAVKDVEHTAVGHGRQGLPGVVTHQPIHGIVHTRGERDQTFAAFEIVVWIAHAILLVGGGMALFTFGRRDALEDAVMPLAQLRQLMDLRTFALRQRLRRLHRALQITAEDGAETDMRGVVGHRQCLRPTGGVERDIQMALDAFLNIPVGLAVADETDAGNGATGKVLRHKMTINSGSVSVNAGSETHSGWRPPGNGSSLHQGIAQASLRAMMSFSASSSSSTGLRQ